VAASRGITVTLWEKGDELGGNLLPASVPEFKKDLRDFVDYQVSQLKKLPVTIKLNRDATAEDIISFGADCVILATCAFQEKPDFIGGDGYRVLTAIELLANGTKIGKDVLVIGGGLIGCETAVYLVQKGHRVTVISRRPRILTDVNFHNVEVLSKMLIDSHVEVLTETKLSGASDAGVVVTQQDKKRVVKADSLVFSEALQSCNQVEKALGNKITNLCSVGDCVKPRRLIDAIWEAFHAALKI
jgi:2-enoate reductase